MGKYRDRTIAVNGRMFYIQYFGKDSWLIWGLVIAFAFMIWSQIVIAFQMPNEQDFASDRYREEAYKTAEKLMINTETKVWNDRGFVESSNAQRSMRISNMRIKAYKDIAEITKYIKNGVYEVHTGTEILLSATSKDGKTTISKGFLSKEYIVAIKSTPKRNWYGTVNLNWKIIGIKVINSSNSEAQIEKIINNWKIPPDKKPDW